MVMPMAWVDIITDRGRHETIGIGRQKRCDHASQVQSDWREATGKTELHSVASAQTQTRQPQQAAGQ